jgi:hypothetical protein
MIKVAILGGSGYTALELFKILLRHPHAQIVAVTSRQEGTPRLDEVHPYLTGQTDLRLENFDVDKLLARGVQCAFGCLPHGVSMSTLPRLLERGVRVVDLSADYRLRDPNVYAQWYGHSHEDLAHLAQAVYGLPEVYGEEIAQAQLIANPGCYPQTGILGLAPLVAGKYSTQPIIVDQTAFPGADRTPPECNERIGLRRWTAPAHRRSGKRLTDVAGERSRCSSLPSGPDGPRHPQHDLRRAASVHHRGHLRDTTGPIEVPFTGLWMMRQQRTRCTDFLDVTYAWCASGARDRLRGQPGSWGQRRRGAELQSHVRPRRAHRPALTTALRAIAIKPRVSPRTRGPQAMRLRSPNSCQRYPSRTASSYADRMRSAGKNAVSKSRWLASGSCSPVSRPSTTRSVCSAAIRSQVYPWRANPAPADSAARDGGADRDHSRAHPFELHGRRSSMKYLLRRGMPGVQFASR